MDEWALALVELLTPPPESQDCVHALTRPPYRAASLEAAARSKGPPQGAPKGAKPSNLLTNLLTLEALEPLILVTAAFHKDYAPSLLSSRSMVRIHQGAFQCGAAMLPL